MNEQEIATTAAEEYAGIAQERFQGRACPWCGRSHQLEALRTFDVAPEPAVSDDPSSSARSAAYPRSPERVLASIRSPESLAFASTWSPEIIQRIEAHGRGTRGSPVPPVPPRPSPPIRRRDEVR